MLKHLQTSHDFDSSRSPRKKTVSPPNKSVAEDPEPAGVVSKSMFWDERYVLNFFEPST